MVMVWYVIIIDAQYTTHLIPKIIQHVIITDIKHIKYINLYFIFMELIMIMVIIIAEIYGS